jgi:hypothetical protein
MKKTALLFCLFAISQSSLAVEVCQVLEPAYENTGYAISCTDKSLQLDKIEGVGKECIMKWGEGCMQYTPYFTIYEINFPKLTKALLEKGYRSNGCGLPTFVKR